MNERELREIKGRFRPERCNIPAIRGCFVNENKQILAKIKQSLAMSGEGLTERLLGVMKKTLSGSLGTNLLNIEFRTRDVESSPEHKLLMRLRASGLSDEEALSELYGKIIESTKLDGNFAILVANDAYDVIKKREDGGECESVGVYNYIVCAVCPLKNIEGGISFKEGDASFHALMSNLVLQRPECGFLFPAFDDRQSNIYGALFYTRSIKDNHAELVSGLFGKTAPMAPTAQKASFNEALANALGDECELDTLRSVHAQISEMTLAHKEARIPEPLTLSAETLKTVVLNSGVDGEKAEALKERIDEVFGKGAAITPKNIINTRQYELRSPDVVIKVNPDRRDLVTTEIINGQKYILIKAEEGVELNGIAVKCKE